MYFGRAATSINRNILLRVETLSSEFSWFIAYLCQVYRFSATGLPIFLYFGLVLVKLIEN